MSKDKTSTLHPLLVRALRHAPEHLLEPSHRDVLDQASGILRRLEKAGKVDPVVLAGAAETLVLSVLAGTRLPATTATLIPVQTDQLTSTWRGRSPRR